jgi:ATP-dependent DNA helicase PIF1
MEKLENNQFNSKQKEAYKLMNEGKSILLTGSAGTGKCLGFDTPIIMHNGNIKMVQDITKGEFIMGDDSTPRKVLSTASGVDELYKVSNSRGDFYVVNSSHILTFKSQKYIIENWTLLGEKYYILEWGDQSGKIKNKIFETKEEAELEKQKLADIVDIEISLIKNRIFNFDNYFQGIYASLEFEEKNLKFDPYLIGICLGIDVGFEEGVLPPKIFQYILKNINDYSFIYKTNFIKDHYIPSEYKFNSRENRFKLLMGILDSIGILNGNEYEIILKKKNIILDIFFIAKSLGLEVVRKIDTNKIKINIKNFILRKENLLFDVKIELIGRGTYYGFEIDGNKRFVLGNFIITHNTTLIKTFYEMKKDSRKSIALTSTTGVSSVLINGTTLHSYLGIGLGTNSAEILINKIRKSKFYLNKWTRLQTLIIDEISMLSPELFDKLEHMAKVLRLCDLPFGGIQLILSGDFFQLPVVKSSYFCFESESWDQCINHIINLDEIIRQNDPIFQKCLNEVRIAQLSKETISILEHCEKTDLTNEFGIKPTRIYPINKSVDKINSKELSKIKSEHYEYEMEVVIHNSKYMDNVSRYKKSIKAEETLILALDAQVMLLANLDIDDGLANGSRGVIINFVNDIPVVKFMNGKEKLIDYYAWELEEIINSPASIIKVASIYQIPLKLAYACTVHSSQGLSLDCVEISMKNIFEYGQAYVAMSRARNLRGLKILDFDIKRIKAHPSAIKFYKILV